MKSKSFENVSLCEVSLHPEPGVEGARREGGTQVDAGAVQERLHQALVSTT